MYSFEIQIIHSSNKISIEKVQNEEPRKVRERPDAFFFAELFLRMSHMWQANRRYFMLRIHKIEEGMSRVRGDCQKLNALNQRMDERLNEGNKALEKRTIHINEMQTALVSLQKSQADNQRDLDNLRKGTQDNLKFSLLLSEQLKILQTRNAKLFARDDIKDLLHSVHSVFRYPADDTSKQVYQCQMILIRRTQRAVFRLQAEFRGKEGGCVFAGYFSCTQNATQGALKTERALQSSPAFLRGDSQIIQTNLLQMPASTPQIKTVVVQRPPERREAGAQTQTQHAGKIEKRLALENKDKACVIELEESDKTPKVSKTLADQKNAEDDLASYDGASTKASKAYSDQQYQEYKELYERKLNEALNHKSTQSEVRQRVQPPHESPPKQISRSRTRPPEQFPLTNRVIRFVAPFFKGFARVFSLSFIALFFFIIKK